jgi:hypothetical protein
VCAARRAGEFYLSVSLLFLLGQVWAGLGWMDGYGRAKWTGLDGTGLGWATGSWIGMGWVGGVLHLRLAFCPDSFSIFSFLKQTPLLVLRRYDTSLCMGFFWAMPPFLFPPLRRPRFFWARDTCLLYTYIYHVGGGQDVDDGTWASKRGYGYGIWDLVGWYIGLGSVRNSVRNGLLAWFIVYLYRDLAWPRPLGLVWIGGLEWVGGGAIVHT